MIFLFNKRAVFFFGLVVGYLSFASTVAKQFYLKVKLTIIVNWSGSWAKSYLAKRLLAFHFGKGLTYGARVAHWWKHSFPSNVAGYKSWRRCHMCSLSLVLSLALRGFFPEYSVFPSPQKPLLPNSNSFWNARTRF